MTSTKYLLSGPLVYHNVLEIIKFIQLRWPMQLYSLLRLSSLVYRYCSQIYQIFNRKYVYVFELVVNKERGLKFYVLIHSPFYEFTLQLIMCVWLSIRLTYFHFFHWPGCYFTFIFWTLGDWECFFFSIFHFFYILKM